LVVLVLVLIVIKIVQNRPGVGEFLPRILNLVLRSVGVSVEGAQVVPLVLEEVSALTARLFDPPPRGGGHRE
jgi:hypothetical protein